MILELKNKDINKFKYLSSSNDFFNSCDISEEYFILSSFIIDDNDWSVFNDLEFIIGFRIWFII
jgi:hypothetical protein